MIANTGAGLKSGQRLSGFSDCDISLDRMSRQYWQRLDRAVLPIELVAL